MAGAPSATIAWPCTTFSTLPIFPTSLTVAAATAASPPLVRSFSHVAVGASSEDEPRPPAGPSAGSPVLNGSLAARNTERSNRGSFQGPPGRTCTGLVRRIVLATSGGHVTASTQRSSDATVHRCYPVPDGTTRAHYSPDDLHHDAASSGSADISSQFRFVCGSLYAFQISLSRIYICQQGYRVELSLDIAATGITGPMRISRVVCTKRAQKRIRSPISSTRTARSELPAFARRCSIGSG